MSATRKIKKKLTLQARLADNKKGGRKPITQQQRNGFAVEGKYICGYLRKHFLSKELPRGNCALYGERCLNPRFMGEEIECPVYSGFMAYRGEHEDEPTDLAELRDYLNAQR